MEPRLNSRETRIYSLHASLSAHNTKNVFFAKIIRLSLWSNLAQKFFLIWLNPRIFMPRQNQVSRMGNLGRVKAVTSNRERTLPLSQ